MVVPTMSLSDPIYDRDSVQKILEIVKDPEIPVLTIEDMGIVRDIEVSPEQVQISITPTYSGCPAMDFIASEIVTVLKLHGYSEVTVKTVLSPAWSSDFISEEGRVKLEEFGIAPPRMESRAAMIGIDPVKCPQCKSESTSLVSEFGSTACKALYKCDDCLEPFDYFKCV